MSTRRSPYRSGDVAAALRALLAALEAAHRGENDASGADLDQLQKLLRDAVQMMQRSFANIDANTRAQHEQLTSLVSMLDGADGGADADSNTLSIRQFSDETTQTLEYFTHLLAQISKQSIEAAYQMDDMIRAMDSVFGLIGKLDGIADTILCLGFNATLEASRAGESGRGFQVVAREVRELARSTKQLNLALTERVSETRQAIMNTQAIIARMASNDLVVALSAKDRVDGMLARLRLLDEHLSRSLAAVGETTHRITAAVGEAITSLQFEDICYQLVDHVRGRMSFLTTVLREAEVGDAGERAPGAALTGLLHAAARRVLRLVGERVGLHKRVEQSSMSAGEVDLF